MKFKIQSSPRRVRIEGVERVIPPLVYREEREDPSDKTKDVEDTSDVAVPVDDTPPPPYRRRRRGNPLTGRRAAAEDVNEVAAV